MNEEQKANWFGKEHQIVGVYDDANHKIQLYADGKLMQEKATETTEGVVHRSPIRFRQSAVVLQHKTERRQQISLPYAYMRKR